MSKQQTLIFNASRELVAIARSISSVAELTKIEEDDIRLYCKNRLNISGLFCSRYKVEPSIAGDDLFGELTIDEYDRMNK